MISRRGLITGLVSFVAAPAIVRAASLMPVKAFELDLDAVLRACHESILKEMQIAYSNLYLGFGLAPIKQEGTFEFRVLDPGEFYLDRS